MLVNWLLPSLLVFWPRHFGHIVTVFDDEDGAAPGSPWVDPGQCIAALRGVVWRGLAFRELRWPPEQTPW